MTPGGSSLRSYHEATKHSAASVTGGQHRLDWSNKPLAFKIYTNLEGIEPPADLGQLCLYSNGVLRWRRDSAGGLYGFRAAPCTGALYHVELYLAGADREGLPAGLYHYGAHDHRLRRLRAGDVRGALVEAGGGLAALASAPLLLILTSTFWRNAWKYRARAYRHVYWDGGAVMANLLALTSAEGLPATVVMGFADALVNRLLGLDPAREVAFALVAVGAGAAPAPVPESLADLDLPTQLLSPREVRYPEIDEAHASSSLASPAGVVSWRERAAAASRPEAASLFDQPVVEVIKRRRSTRRFGPAPITRAQLQAALTVALAPVASDALDAGLVEPFLIVNSVDGLERGTYRGDLSLIQAGDFRRAAGQLALWQPLGAEAAANVYFMSDLDAVLQRFGGRGYRLAQMAGGIAGARLELAAVASGLAATGLTFFDDEVTSFFAPAAGGRQVMYLAAIGSGPG